MQPRGLDGQRLVLQVVWPHQPGRVAARLWRPAATAATVLYPAQSWPDPVALHLRLLPLVQCLW